MQDYALELLACIDGLFSGSVIVIQEQNNEMGRVLPMSEESNSAELLSLTTNIVSAHVSNNSVSMTDLPQLIRDVYNTLSAVDSGAEQEVEPISPAVPIKKSITPDFIICLEDGKKLKMLKRHLKTAYNMTPDEYRDRWGLAADYPMVAPNYAKQRSKLAKQIGLGTKARRRRR